MKRWCLPKHIHLPWNFIVKVVQLSPEALYELAGPGVQACWTSDDRTIYLDKTRSIRCRRADLAHEMLHAVADWEVWVMGSHLSDVKG
ncbi:MAG: hypothetical protein CV089_02235 [Nitrospira sp. WS110]|nr:hypothetical protein [Nitrospira sp. WS110]